MAFSRPTLARLINRAQSDLEANLQNGASRIRRSVEYVLARVSAGLAHGQHGHIQYVSEQIVPDLAADEWLVRHAAMWGLTRTPATQAAVSILVTGVAGSPIPAGSVWASADGATTYSNPDAASIPAVAPLEVVVAVVAGTTLSDPTNGTGADGNAEGAATLALTNPVVGIDVDATVEGTPGELQGGGANIETVDALRERLRERVRTPPSGGGPGDYVRWAKTVSGVTRAWETPLALGPGTVRIVLVQDILDADSNFVDTVFPDAGTVAAVQDVIDASAPVASIPVAASAVEQELSPSIQLSPNTPAAQAQVIVALNDYLLRNARPSGTLLLSEINEAIGLAPDEDDHVTLSPVANVTAAETTVITLGTVTFSAIP